MASQQSIIIIRRVQFTNPEQLPIATQQRLRELEANDKAGTSLTLPQKVYVAWQALRSLSR